MAPVFNVWDRMPPDGEVIEDASQEDLRERHDDEEEEEEDDEMILDTAVSMQRKHVDSPFSSKRRRLSLDEVPSEYTQCAQFINDNVSTRPTFGIPPTSSVAAALPAKQATPRRFVFAQHGALPSIASQPPIPDDPHHQPTRPAFLKPPSATVHTSEPLPEAFSPHRRGQKFIPGGMASELRQWIVDAAQMAAHSHNRRSDGQVSHVHVMESRGSAKDGMVLVRGFIEGNDIRLILPGAGKSKNASVISPGDFVGIKAPTWDVEMEGESWIVAADWRVSND